jgi:outer membrane immunogenic protein
MRRITMLAAAAVFVGGMSFASAADLSLKDTPYSPTPLAPVWGGMYVGGHLGGLWRGDEDTSAKKKECAKWERYGCTSYCAEWAWRDTNRVSFEEDDDEVSLVGGVHVGYNWQRNSTVIGIEADVDFADQIDYLASLRARLGYASGNFLIYATAGVALAQFDEDPFKFKIGGKSFAMNSEDEDAKIGFVVGGGVEYKLRPNWSVGVEGLYYAFEDESSEHTVWKNGKKYKVTEEDDGDFFVVRARLSYHFQSEAEIEPLK